MPINYQTGASPFFQGAPGPAGPMYRTPDGEFQPGSTAMTGPRPYGNISGFGRR
jgi:hypothetical protein